MKIRLRYELWEYHTGLGFRRASRAENAAHRNCTEGLLRQVFYAASEFDAAAQYYDLRNFGPLTPSNEYPTDPFSREELEAQFADFPEDTALAAQMLPRLKRKDVQVAAPELESATSADTALNTVNARPEPLKPAPNLTPSTRKRAKSGAWGVIRGLIWLLVIGAAVAAFVVFIRSELQQQAPIDRDLVPVPRERSVSPL